MSYDGNASNEGRGSLDFRGQQLRDTSMRYFYALSCIDAYIYFILRIVWKLL